MYEYHLMDGTIETSDVANISSFIKSYCTYYNEAYGGMDRDDVDVPVRYCIIKCQEDDDSDICHPDDRQCCDCGQHPEDCECESEDY